MRYMVKIYRDHRDMEEALNNFSEGSLIKSDWTPLLVTAVKERGLSDTTEYTVIYQQKEQK